MRAVVHLRPPSQATNPTCRLCRWRFFWNGNKSCGVLPARLTRPTADFYVYTDLTRACDRAPLRGRKILGVLRCQKKRNPWKTRAVTRDAERARPTESAPNSLRKEPIGCDRRVDAKSAARTAVIHSTPQPARRRESEPRVMHTHTAHTHRPPQWMPRLTSTPKQGMLLMQKACLRKLSKPTR